MGQWAAEVVSDAFGRGYNAELPSIEFGGMTVAHCAVMMVVHYKHLANRKHGTLAQASASDVAGTVAAKAFLDIQIGRY